MDHLAILNRIAVPGLITARWRIKTARTIQEILFFLGRSLCRAGIHATALHVSPDWSFLSYPGGTVLPLRLEEKTGPGFDHRPGHPHRFDRRIRDVHPVGFPLIQKTGHNVIVNFTVPNAARELFFCAHYTPRPTSGTRIQRGLVYRWIPVAVVLALILPGWLLLVKIQGLGSKLYRAIALISAGALIIYWGLVALGFGGFIFLSKESPGAVDNATSVVTLLNLSKDIREGKVRLGKPNVTILFTGGEEVGLQGADRYVQDRFRENPEHNPSCLRRQPGTGRRRMATCSTGKRTAYL